ncbi:MAG TPA: hypothetical protein VMW24_20005 [Sedimentisphaerales bacterium]|nr:hypothetical protein [Sedimentisphaerales bacterium]
MALKKIAALLVTCACLLLLTTSCSRYGGHTGPVIVPGNGPPAHAPAHGYRRKQVSGVELVFDSGRGVYVVVGFPDHYYHDGYFYRLRAGAWEMSLKPDTGWASVSMASLPPGLQARGHDNGNHNGRGHGNGKNKKAS